MKRFITLISKFKKTIIAISTVLFLYLGCYHYTDNYEFGITYNWVTGNVLPDAHTGHHFTAPWVLATKIDTRPHKVCIASASRNINCRLVQFDTAHWKDLIAIEGFRYYWWYNRFSFNSGQETYRGIDNLLLGHAYGTNRCPCVKVLEEIGD